MLTKTIFLSYITSIFKVVTSFNTNKGFILIPTFFSLTWFLTISDELKGLILLGVLIIFDFITGILASSYIRKDNIKKGKEVSKRLIESSKLRLSGVKFYVYFSTIVLAWLMHHIWVLKNFEIWISEEPKGIVLIVIGFWCLVEIYSIVFENFKDMGIDVLSIFEKLKKIYNKFKTNNDS